VPENLRDDPETIQHLKDLYWCMLRMWISVLTICATRFIFLIVDPYTMRAVLPRVVEGLMYGTIYPCLNLCAVEILWLVGLYAWPKVYKVCLVCCFFQFLTQWTMDALRAEALHPAWHYVCQVFYITWGGCVLITGFIASRKASNLVVSVDTLLSGFGVIISIVLMIVKFGGPMDDAYFWVETILRAVELVATASYVKCIALTVKDNTPPGGQTLEEWINGDGNVPTFRMRRVSSVCSVEGPSGPLTPELSALHVPEAPSAMQRARDAHNAAKPDANSSNGSSCGDKQEGEGPARGDGWDTCRSQYERTTGKVSKDVSPTGQLVPAPVRRQSLTMGGVSTKSLMEILEVQNARGQSPVGYSARRLSDAGSCRSITSISSELAFAVAEPTAVQPVGASSPVVQPRSPVVQHAAPGAMLVGNPVHL